MSDPVSDWFMRLCTEALKLNRTLHVRVYDEQADREYQMVVPSKVDQRMIAFGDRLRDAVED